MDDIWDPKYYAAIGKAVVIDIMLILVFMLGFVVYNFFIFDKFAMDFFFQNIVLLSINNLIVLFLLLTIFISQASREI